MLDELKKDLMRCTDLLQDFPWSVQNNASDQATNFIYRCDSLDDCLQSIADFPEELKQYALHRWYNFKTSIVTEYLFCEFGAVHERNKYHHDIDIYVYGVPYDVKLSVYPKKYDRIGADLYLEVEKDRLIKWLYEHQSGESRKQFVNRLYVVCGGETERDRLKNKCNFTDMSRKISNFMTYYKNQPQHTLTLSNGYGVYSNLIFIE